MKLETNLIKTGSNWQFDKKHFRGIPKKSKGVYIVGVLKETEIGEKFCPLYVGTHKSDLAGRIEGHWDKDNTETVRGSLNSFKEIFDLSLSPDQFYKGIEIWNKEWKGKRFKDESKKMNQLRHFFQEVQILGYNSLLWFPNENFFQSYFSNPNINYSPKLNHHTSTLLPNDLYDELVKETQLMSKIIKTKNIISDKFWYYYITVEEDIKLEELEAYVNHSLIQKYGIYTYAKSNNPKLDFNIDWSDFEKEIFTI